MDERRGSGGEVLGSRSERQIALRGAMGAVGGLAIASDETFERRGSDEESVREQGEWIAVVQDALVLVAEQVGVLGDER
jgi:hypothetical protein